MEQHQPTGKKKKKDLVFASKDCADEQYLLGGHLSFGIIHMHEATLLAWPLLYIGILSQAFATV